MKPIIRVKPTEVDVIVVRIDDKDIPTHMEEPKPCVLRIDTRNGESNDVAKTIVVRAKDLPILPRIIIREEDLVPNRALTSRRVIRVTPQIESLDLPRHMLELINRDRANNSEFAGELRPLQWDDALAAVARAHSEDMIAKQYMGHVNPENLSPADRLIRAGIYFLVCGENIAGSPTRTGYLDDSQTQVTYTGYPTIEAAEIGLMNSPQHRDNLLQHRFTHVGVGIARNADGTLVVTQNFVGR